MLLPKKKILLQAAVCNSKPDLELKSEPIIRSIASYPDSINLLKQRIKRL